MIQIEKTEDNRITTFSLIGPASLQELLPVIEEEYPKVGYAIIWDFTEGDNSVLRKDEMIEIARHVKRYSRHKKTAYIGVDDLEFGLMRMYQTYAAIQEVAPHMGVFRSRQEALAWINNSAAN